MLQKIWDWLILDVVGEIKWQFLAKIINKNKKYYKLDDVSLEEFRQRLIKDYYLIVIRRDTHLTTYLLSLAEFLMRGKWGFWSHCAMNTEDVVTKDEDFRIIEATKIGVHYSTFMQVFDCDSASLLIPKGFTLEEWTRAVEDATLQLGKKYDTVFNCVDDTKLSCIEVIRHALMAACFDYYVDFAAFESMFQKYKKLSPQMLYDCGDFVVMYEVRK